MKSIINWTVGICAVLALSVNVGCGGEAHEASADELDADLDAELGEVEQAIRVGVRANDGSVAPQMMGGLQADGVRIQRCNTSECGTGALALRVPALQEIGSGQSLIRGFRIGIGTGGGVGGQLTQHATRFCNALPGQLFGYGCSVQQGCSSPGNADSGQQLVCLSDGRNNVSSSTRATDFSGLACLSFRENRVTFGGKAFDVRRCTQYTANVAQTRINGLSLGAGQKIALGGIVTVAVFSSMLFGIDGGVLAAGSTRNLLPSPIPGSAPALSLGNPQRCLAIGSRWNDPNGTHQLVTIPSC